MARPTKFSAMKGKALESVSESQTTTDLALLEKLSSGHDDSLEQLS